MLGKKNRNCRNLGKGCFWHWANQSLVWLVIYIHYSIVTSFLQKQKFEPYLSIKRTCIQHILFLKFSYYFIILKLELESTNYRWKPKNGKVLRGKTGIDIFLISPIYMYMYMYVRNDFHYILTVNMLFFFTKRIDYFLILFWKAINSETLKFK